MKIIHWSRHGGKLNGLVKEARKHGGILIVNSEAAKRYVVEKWADTEVYTYNELLNNDISDNQKPIFIDEAENLLGQLVAGYTNGKVMGVSFTGERE